MVFLHKDLTIFTKAIKRAYIQSVVVQPIKHAAPTERDWNKYLHFLQSARLTVTVMARTTETNNNWDRQSTLKYYVRTQRNNKIYYLHV